VVSIVNKSTLFTILLEGKLEFGYGELMLPIDTHRTLLVHLKKHLDIPLLHWLMRAISNIQLLYVMITIGVG
jgi:hypothetical protein